MALPLVSALMITANKPERRGLLKMAIQCFFDQDYPNKELIIVNHGKPTGFDGPDVHEHWIRDKSPITLGELRNITLARMNGEIGISFDDDDFHHPERLSFSVNGLLKSKKQAAVFAEYITYDVTTGEAFIRNGKHYKCGGCCGLICFHRTDRRYPKRNRHEDANFAEAFHKAKQLAVLDNPAHYYIRTTHPYGTSPQEHVLRPGDGRIDLDTKWLHTLRHTIFPTIQQAYERKS